MDLTNIEEAKKYVLKRVQAEQNGSDRVHSLIIECAYQIISLSSKYNSDLFSFAKYPELKKKVDKLIEKLKEDIEIYTFTYAVLCTDDDEDKSRIYSHSFGNKYGDTFEGRTDKYLDRFSNEVEMFISAGIVLGLPTDKVMTAYKAECEHPYSESIITRASKINPAIVTKTNLGVGKSNPSLIALEKLARMTIADGWSFNNFYNASKNGASGFYVFRGSSYPCIECNSHVGWLHTMLDDYPPFHAYCKCYTVYVF